MRSIRICLTVAFALLFFFGGTGAPCSAGPIQDELKITIDKILDILKDPALKGEAATRERRAALRNAIWGKFNFERMSQLSLGRYWRDRTPEERQIFIDLFGRLLEDTYASKIESYTDERVEFVKELVSEPRAQVHTKVVTGTMEVPIEYRLYLEKNNVWMVYDIVIEGVSLVGNYRSQFDQILQKEGFGKLLEDLKNKTAL